MAAGGVGQQRAEVVARQQQGRGGPAPEALAEQRVAHDRQEHLRAGLGRGQVQRRDAQRLDQLVHRTGGQGAAQLAHRERRRADKTRALPRQRGAHQRKPLAPRPAARGQDRGHGVQRRRPARGPGGRLQAAAVGVGQGQRSAEQDLFRLDAQALHQAQRIAVGTDQDVLAVVQPQWYAVGPRGGQGAGAAAGRASGFEQGDVCAEVHRLHGGGQACPAGTNNRQLHNRPKACTFHASQNLRSGVRLTRCVSTSTGSAAISCSRVR